MNCPHCGARIDAQARFCGHCGQSVVLPPTPPVATKPKGGNGGLKFLGVLVAIAGIALLCLWYFKIGPFYPSVQVATLSQQELDGEVDIKPPTEKEMQEFSAYLATLQDRSYGKMSSSDKVLAADLQALSTVLVGANYSIDDITRALQGWTVDYVRPDFQLAVPLNQQHLQAATVQDFAFPRPAYTASAGGLNLEGLAGGLSQLSQLFSGAGEEGEEGTALTQEEIMAGLGEIMGALQNGVQGGENTNPLMNEALTFIQDALAAAEDDGLPEPMVPAHGNWPRITMIPEQPELHCHACGTSNAVDATNCVNCSALLIQPVYMVGIDTTPPPPMPPEEEYKPVMNAVTLNNIANEMMLQGYADLPYFLACMAAVEDPLNTDVICTIANLLKTSEDYENALACAEYALRITPNEEDLLYTAGMVCLKLDQVDKAARFFNRALRVSGGGGPGNQGMMMVSLARQDFPSAFLYMIEGGRDAFTTSIMDVYKRMKLRPDYKTMSGSIFDQYTLMELMNFKRNRTAFDPTLDTIGQQISVGRMSVPVTANDWAASCGYIFEDSLLHLKGYGPLLAEDVQQVAEIIGIFTNFKDLKDLEARVMGSSLAPKPKSEAEEMVSYEQEMFWLNILNDYMEWELAKIKDERNAAMAAVEGAMEGVDIVELMGEMMEKNFQYSDDGEFNLAQYYAVISLVASNIETNNTIMLTYEQGQQIMSYINQHAGTYGMAFNAAYEKTRILCEEYWLYSNAILGLIADDATYNDYRTKQRHMVMVNLAPYAVEAAMFSFTVYLVYPVVMTIGVSSYPGMQSGYIPDAPKLTITGKGATPYALMYGDVFVPNIPEVVKEVVGLSQEEIAENIAMQMAREQQDEYQAWWNSLTPEERVKHAAIKADPTVLTRQLILQPYGGSGMGVIGFYEESTDPKLAASYSASNGVAKLKIDTNGNVNVSVKDMVGVSANPKDVTIYAGASKGFISGNINAGSAGIATGSGAKADAQIYATYNYGKRQFTSGGVKAGVSARLGSAVGIEAKTGHNVVTGLTTGDIGVIWQGKKFGIRGIQSWNLW